jgi:hypothetical protein
VREAVELLRGGWQIADVARHLGKARSTLNHHLHVAGLPSAQRIYRDARDRRYEQLQAQGFGASDIADMTGTSRDSFNNWRQTHEAGLPHTSKSLKTLHKSGRKKGSGATGAQQKQMSLL